MPVPQIYFPAKSQNKPSLTQVFQQVNTKFKTINTHYKLDLEVDSDTLNKGVDYAIKEKLKDVKQGDKIRVIIETDDGFISTPYINPENLSDWFDGDGNFSVDSGEADTNFVDSVSGGGSIQIGIASSAFSGGRGKQINDKSKIYQKKSILRIKNTDNLCLGRCIVCELANRDNHPKKSQIRAGRKIQTELTTELYNNAGIEPEIASLDTIRAFEKYLDCSITIVDGNQFNNVIYPDITDTEYEPNDFNIYLYKNKNHYDLINSKKIAGFFAKTYFCDKCKKTHTTPLHKCVYKCNICCRNDCDFVGGDFKLVKEWFACDCCNRNFASQKCFDNHKTSYGKLEPACDRMYKCKGCKKKFFEDKQPRATHKCGDFVCGNCKQVCCEKEHKCYMTPKPIKEFSEDYIYFDFECDITAEEHIVNYCVAQYHNDTENFCFTNLEDFCRWALQEKHNGFTFIAHNGRGYDFQIVMKWIYQNTTYKPFCIYAGSKIMTFSIKGELKIRFVDSLNFITDKLANFPKTFGIKELKKGFYPYWFNCKKNFNYIGEMPERRLFKPNQMKTGDRAEFLEWYKNKVDNNYIWNHAEETKTYCISDVDILRRSCEIFRNTYIEIANIDPLTYTTIASVCMAIYKGNYIVPNYSIDYHNCITKEEKEELRVSTIEKVFREKKIAIFNYQDQDFIRKSFFGGRTNAIKLKYDFKDNEEGIYSDITSLYPSVNYFDPYPTGHPIIITENFIDIKNYFGFVDCDIVCPKDLYFPVLARKGDKLLFDLEDKRGVWATNELQKAVEKGYTIKKIYKVFHFEKTSTDLFKPYVAKFLKIKQEASGLPKWCKTPQDTEKYILDYKVRQGIQLDINKIKYNTGMRAIAKLCLNSLWGKFGQRSNMPQTEIINDKSRYYEIMFNDEKFCNQNFYAIDDERLEMTFKNTEDNIQTNFNTNLAIASFTTSSARLRLYEGLDLLDRQVLYHDTDSLVYVYDNNKPEGVGNEKLPLGDLLGDWTDELDGTKMIGTFVSGGPKNYSYETDDGEYHTKIKGFTLNWDAVKVLNHNSMINMIDTYQEYNSIQKLSVNYNLIQRHKDKKLTNYNQTKQYGFTYDKRVILPIDKFGNIDTLPIGFIKT